MRYRTKLWLLWLVPVILTLASLTWLGWQIHQVVPDPSQRDQTLLWLMLAVFAIVGVITTTWAMLDWYCFIPLGALARGARIRATDLALSDHGELMGLEELLALPYREAHNQLDRYYLRRIMAETRGNITRAAQRLGTSRRALRERLKRLNLYSPE